MRRILLAMAVAALMAVMTAGAAAAQEGPPVDGCPTGFEPVTVEFVLAHSPDPNGVASMDPNGDGFTCLKFLHTGSGLRATWHDNVTPL